MKRTPGQTLDERAKAVLGMYGDPVAFVGPARDLIRELLALVAVMDETAESLALAHER